jgi:hypothetical protein
MQANIAFCVWEFTTVITVQRHCCSENSDFGFLCIQNRDSIFFSCDKPFEQKHGKGVRTETYTIGVWGKAFTLENVNGKQV